jgi:hypothetical protein
MLIGPPVKSNASQDCACVHFVFRIEVRPLVAGVWLVQESLAERARLYRKAVGWAILCQICLAVVISLQPNDELTWDRQLLIISGVGLL